MKRFLQFSYLPFRSSFWVTSGWQCNDQSCSYEKTEPQKPKWKEKGPTQPNPEGLICHHQKVFLPQTNECHRRLNFHLINSFSILATRSNHLTTFTWSCYNFHKLLRLWRYSLLFIYIWHPELVLTAISQCALQLSILNGQIIFCNKNYFSKLYYLRF